jgi:hypothetical protein
MKKNTHFSLSILLMLSLVVLSCKQDVLDSLTDNQGGNTIPSQSTTQNHTDGAFELGEKLNNPYSIKNMEVALKELQNQNPDYANHSIEANYNYVRIEAQTEEALIILGAKEDIDLYNYPLDYEVLKSGTFYKEKDKNSKFQVYWAAVPIDYTFDKGLNVTVLEKLFLPAGNGKTNAKNSAARISGDTKFLEALEEKTLSLFDKNYKKSANAKVAAEVRPYGNITVWDDYLSAFVPVEGVTIKGKRWFTVREVVTNVNGYYDLGYTYNGPVDMTIHWETSNFVLGLSVLDGVYSTTFNNISSLPWSPKIVGSTSQIYTAGAFYSPSSFKLAHIFRGAYTYYFKNYNWAIAPPPLRGDRKISSLNPLANIKLYIALADTDGDIIAGGSHTWMTDNLYLAGIVMECKSRDTYVGEYRAINLFSTTVHELAHASHWKFGMNNALYFADKSLGALAESWAMGVEYRITMDVYGGLLRTYQPWVSSPMPEYDRRDLQSKPAYYYSNLVDSDRQRNYTPLFIDLMDDKNQYFVYSNSGCIYETVSGYSLGFLESKLRMYPTNWDGLRNEIYNSTGNSEVTFLFNTYKRVR